MEDLGAFRTLRRNLIASDGPSASRGRIGIYALMSFTVSRRRREIGIRTALGAGPQRILWSLFSRAVCQLAIGVALGLGVAALLENLSKGEMLGGKGAVLLPAVSVLLLAAGLLAAIEPTQRGLRIEPAEALREQQANSSLGA